MSEWDSGSAVTPPGQPGGVCFWHIGRKRRLGIAVPPVVPRRGAAAGLPADPVPQAMVITGLVVAFAATALALVLTLRLHQTTGAVTLAEDPPPSDLVTNSE